MSIFIAGFGIPRPAVLIFNNPDMKKLFTIAACALMAFVSCKQQTNAEKTQAYQDAMDALIQEYQTGADALQADSTLAKEDLYAKFAELEEKVTEKMNSLALATIKKNPKDSVSLVALRDCYYTADPEELQPAINALSEELKQDRFVQRVMESLAAKVATKEGNKFVDFTVSHVAAVENGEPKFEQVSLSDYVGRGKFMLVDFWSPWCPPCKREIPNIKSIYEKYHGDNFDVLSVSVWEESRGMNYQNTIDTAVVYGINWNQINNGHSEPTNLYGIDGIPHIILFGPDGTILKRGLAGEELAAAVAEALGVNE